MGDQAQHLPKCALETCWQVARVVNLGSSGVAVCGRNAFVLQTNQLADLREVVLRLLFDQQLEVGLTHLSSFCRAFPSLLDRLLLFLALVSREEILVLASWGDMAAWLGRC